LIRKSEVRSPTKWAPEKKLFEKHSPVAPFLGLVKKTVFFKQIASICHARESGHPGSA
jgi:hypothetical protein